MRVRNRAHHAGNGRPSLARDEELSARGYRLLHGARTEPWNQTITRLLSPEGLLVGVCYTRPGSTTGLTRSAED
jgi:hypothetical protein